MPQAEQVVGAGWNSSMTFAFFKWIVDDCSAVRRLIYLVSVTTGLRANEMRRVKVKDVSFGDIPFTKLRANTNRIVTAIRSRCDQMLSAELKEWVVDRSLNDSQIQENVDKMNRG